MKSFMSIKLGEIKITPKRILVLPIALILVILYISLEILNTFIDDFLSTIYKWMK